MPSSTKPTTEERLEVERVIATGLRSAIARHGPVDVELAMSAAKRVYGALRAEGMLRDDG